MPDGPPKEIYIVDIRLASMKTSTLWAIVAVIIIAILGGALVYQYLTAVPTGEEAPILEVVHYWTSGSEQAAIEEVFSVFKEEYPEVSIVSAPIAGGGGTTMVAVLTTKMLAGEAPDAFQTQPGYRIQPYADADLIQSLNTMYDEMGWSDVLPEEFLEWGKYEDEYLMVPVNLHRRNVIFYNTQIFEDAGITEEPTTWEELWDACDAIEGIGVTPLSVGLRDKPWPAQHFSIIAYSHSIEFTQDLYNGEITDPNDSDLRTVLGTLAKLYSYIDTSSFGRTWDESSAAVYTGNAAMQFMGDWAKGEFDVVANWTYGVEYDSFPAPGTAEYVIPSIDSFAMPQGSLHPTQAERFLEILLTEEVQIEFNKLKGSTPIVIGTSAAEFDEYHQEIMQGLEDETLMLLPGGRHTMMPPVIQTEFQDILHDFAVDLDIDKAADALMDSVTTNEDAFTITWQIAP